MGNYILETKGLTKTFKGQVAVNHLDLKVEKVLQHHLEFY